MGALTFQWSQWSLTAFGPDISIVSMVSDSPRVRKCRRRGSHPGRVDRSLLQQFFWLNSATGTRTRVARVRAEYPNQLDYSGGCKAIALSARHGNGVSSPRLQRRP